LKKFQVPNYGVVGVEGLPGSGKSFFMVQQVIKKILEESRPVYTNLPIRWRVLRQYLRNRGGEDYANLLFELTKEHFLAFCERQTAKALYMDRNRVMRGKRVPPRLLKEGWEAVHGPDLITQEQADAVAVEAWRKVHGADRTLLEWEEACRNGRTKRLSPNWIPATSVVMVDEAHQWFPQDDQKNEPKCVLAYITKHRHHIHEFWWATQARMQVSITFRRNMDKLWCVRNIKEDALAWGLKWKHLRVSGFGYAMWTGDQIEERSSDNKTPRENHVILPWLPKNQVFFRLYSSFTHIASQAQIMRELHRARVDAGVIQRAVDVEQRRRIQAKFRKETRMGRWGKRLAMAAGVGVVFAVGAVLGSARGPAALGDGGKQASDQASQSSAAASVVAASFSWDGLKLAGVSDGFIRIGRDRVRVGERVSNGAVLLEADRGARVALFRFGDDVWVWGLRDASPRKLGTIEEVRTALHAVRTRGIPGGPSESDSGNGNLETVEPADGVGVGDRGPG